MHSPLFLYATDAIIWVHMLEAYGLSDPGCVRSLNEDCFLIDDRLHLYVVADGMGGAAAGEKAARIAVETVAECVGEAKRWDSNTLISAFHRANQRVREQAGADSELYGMGTTLSACLSDGRSMYIANVGDSRVYAHTDGRLVALTDDHSWVHEVGRRLGLEETALRAHPMRHVLTMAVGVTDHLRVHSYCVPLRAGLEFLLCSDGLHGVVDGQKILEILQRPAPLKDRCRWLIEAARLAGGPDNVTAVIVRSG